MTPASRYAAALAGAAALAFLGAACHRDTGESAVATALTPPVTVTVRAAKVQTLRDTIVAQGTVVAAPSGIFTVIAPQSAKIVELPKNEGDTVASGDILARFDLTALSSDLAVKGVEVDAANNKLAAAKAELAKQEGLFAKGYTPRNTYEAAKAAVITAQTAVDRIKTQQTAANAINDNSIVRAPFSGIVTRKLRNAGDVVEPTDNGAVLQMVDPTRVQVAVQVTPSQEIRVVAGQSATITQTDTSETQPATVIIAPPVVSLESATPVEVRLSLTGAAPPPITTPVSVEILVAQREHAVVVPDTALVRDGTNTFVMVAGADGRAHRRDVRIGLTAGHLTEIVSGITDGDEVIVGGLDQVNDGAPIQIDRGK
jgi:RND family efflux transporter MFP subunit